MNLLGQTIHYDESPYGKYRIVDTTYNRRPARILYGTGSSPQSGLALDDDPELLFDYNQRFMEIIMSTQPKSLLVLGGGAFTLPTAAYHRFPDLSIDVVEIDKLLLSLAKEYFGLPSDKRLQVFISDALKYLKTTTKRYDTIVIDAFYGYTIPPSLLQLSAVQLYSEHLLEDGVVAINLISEYKRGQKNPVDEIIAEFSEIFNNLALYQSDPYYLRGEEQNMLLVAGQGDLEFDYLQSKNIIIKP